MDVFQPAGGHDRDLVGALSGQVGRPGQTEDFDHELLVDGGQVGLHDFGHDLAGGVAGVVEHLDAEAHFPDIIGVFASGDAVFIDIGQLEFLGAFVQVHAVEGSLGIETGHARQRQHLGLHSFAFVHVIDDGVPVKAVGKRTADVDIGKEISRDAVAVELVRAQVRVQDNFFSGRGFGGNFSRRGFGRLFHSRGLGRGGGRRGTGGQHHAEDHQYT